MKTYTFFYTDSYEDLVSLQLTEFTVVASRFSVAFNSFCSCLAQFGYFYFLSSYRICSKDRTSYRTLPARSILHLDKMRCAI